MTNFYTQNLQTISASIDILSKQIKDSEVEPNSQNLPGSAEIIQKLTESEKPPFAPQLIAVLVSSWPSLACGASLGFITPALPLLQKPSQGLADVSEAHLSWMASLTMVGALVGAALSGPCIAFGRRTALWTASLPLALAWAGLALAHAPWPLLLTHTAHTIFGVCMGIIGDAGQLYVNEVSRPSKRGALSCVPVLMFNAGTLACYAASLFLDSWRQMAWFGFILTCPCFLIPVFIPETPSFLASRKNVEAAIRALEIVRGLDWDTSSELSELLQLRPTATSWRGRLHDLRAATRSICVVGVVRVFSRLCGLRAVLAFLQPVLDATESSVKAASATVLIGVLQWAATLAACFLLDRCGRRLLLVASQAAMALALMGMAFGPGGPWPLLCLSIFIAANSVGLGPVSGLLLGEMVAQQHRSVASSVTGAASWIAAFVVTKTFFDLQHLFGSIPLVLALYAAFCAAGALAAGLWVPETRGISLLQLEEEEERPPVLHIA